MRAEEVAGAARSSLLLSFAGRYGAVPLRLVAMMALARLLSPEAFGAHATALAAVQLVGVLADMGAAQYLVQAPAITEAAKRSALGLGLTLGAAAATPLVLLGALAPEAWFGPGVGTTLAVAALTLLVQPAVAVLSAERQRALRFGAIALAGLAGAAVLTGAAIALALLGFGPVALALASLLELLAVAAILARGRGLPRPSFSGWAPIFGFGWVWGAIGGLRQAGDAASRLAVGAVLGLGPLGLLTRAQGVVQIFDKALLDAISPVVLPALSAAQRAGRALGPVYLHQVACIAAVAWPFFGALGLLAEPLVRLLLGPGWEAAVPALRVLCLAGLALPLSALTLPYLVAVERLRDWLPVQAGLQVGRIVLVGAAAFVSLEAVAAVLAAEQAAKALAAQTLLSRHLAIAPGGVSGALLRSAAPALAALCPVAAIGAFAAGMGPFALLGLAALCAAPAWWLAIRLVRHPLGAEVSRLRPAALQLARASARMSLRRTT